MPVSLETAF